MGVVKRAFVAPSAGLLLAIAACGIEFAPAATATNSMSSPASTAYPFERSGMTPERDDLDGADETA